PKKHRGAGSRGGRGMAGSGKKGQQKMTALHLIKRTIGKSGFTRPQKVIANDTTMNVSRLEQNLDKYVKNNIAKKTGDMFEVDLTKAGVVKVLGTGKLNAKLTVTADKFSKSAIQKIENAGGKAIVLLSDE
ncbi:MAG: uL15m family ribosomal protein, partial [archaeon]|nr:uL15m family ribosomal protein [archaeon]